jgi:2-dehydropantoate 2-reductase
MKIAIVGPGAVGRLFAARLAAAGAGVLLIDYKPERAAAIAERGIVLEEPDGNEIRVAVPASADPAAAGSADGLIFAVKAYATESAARRLAPFARGDAWALTLQNGMGNAETLAEAFGAERVLAGTTSEGVTLLGTGRVRHAGRGETFVGGYCGGRSGRAAEIAAAFNSAGFKASVTDDARTLLWRKLLVSVGINPATALLRIRNGDVLERAGARAVMRAAVLEAAAVARAAGIEIDAEDAVRLAESVARGTAANISSMHQDIAAGRRTEIDFICGFVVREGARLGIATPVNNTLLNLIRGLEPK